MVVTAGGGGRGRNIRSQIGPSGLRLDHLALNHCAQSGRWSVENQERKLCIYIVNCMHSNDSLLVTNNNIDVLMATVLN